MEEESIKLEPTESMGMSLTKITYKSCTARIGVGDNWATIYSIESDEQGKGHCQELCKQAKEYYSQHEKVFGSTVALNPTMKHILIKLEIPEYD